MSEADIGVAGLGVMGRNLALNMAGHGYTVAGFDIDAAKVSAWSSRSTGEMSLIAVSSPEEMSRSLKRPRRILMMVPAGSIVDQLIERLLPHLQAGDILVDGGNSHFKDTVRRVNEVEAKGISFIGMGVSGGEEGARTGPSLMPGGSQAACPHVRGVFQDIAAKVEDGTPCCNWIGPGGAGHFVKMVHNGIEYGDMQLICEAYSVMCRASDLDPNELSEIFSAWNQGVLDSYLIEITSRIFAQKDPETGEYVIDYILDAAGQKGTGKWTSMAALDLGVAAPTIAEAVFARCLSAFKEERVEAARNVRGPQRAFCRNRTGFIEDIRKALYASKICSYAQGFALLREASATYGWNLDYGEIALLWREGCIIRARFLDRIKEAFVRQGNLPNLLLSSYFKKEVQNFFGAHTYERVDKPRGEFFHTEWEGGRME